MSLSDMDYKKTFFASPCHFNYPFQEQKCKIQDGNIRVAVNNDEYHNYKLYDSDEIMVSVKIRKDGAEDTRPRTMQFQAMTEASVRSKSSVCFVPVKGGLHFGSPIKATVIKEQTLSDQILVKVCHLVG